jgi:hypothetical protein
MKKGVSAATAVVVTLGRDWKATPPSKIEVKLSVCNLTPSELKDMSTPLACQKRVAAFT